MKIHFNKLFFSLLFIVCLAGLSIFFSVFVFSIQEANYALFQEIRSVGKEVLLFKKKMVFTPKHFQK